MLPRAASEYWPPNAADGGKSMHTTCRCIRRGATPMHAGAGGWKWNGICRKRIRPAPRCREAGLSDPSRKVGRVRAIACVAPGVVVRRSARRPSGSDLTAAEQTAPCFA